MQHRWLLLSGILLATSVIAGERDFIPVGASELQEGGKVYVFGMGISDFKHLKPDEDLDFTEADAEHIAETLVARSGGVITEDDITLFLGREATYSAVDESIRSLLASAGPRDTVILYFSTHGVMANDEGYLMTWDSPRTEEVAFRSLSFRVLDGYIEQSRAGNVLVFTDACHSALSGRGLRSGPTNPVNADLLKVGTGRNSVFNMASSLVNQLSHEGAEYCLGAAGCEGRGAFTSQLVEALRGGADENGDGRVDLGELASQVTPMVRTVTNFAQTPEAKGHYDQSLVISLVDPTWIAPGDPYSEEKLRQSYQRAHQQRTAAHQAQAAARWTALQPLLASREEAEPEVRAFVDGFAAPVEVMPGFPAVVIVTPEVDEARRWLAQDGAQEAVLEAGDPLEVPWGTMRWVPPTSAAGYTMLSGAQVVLTEGLWVSEVEVSQALYEEVVGNNPSQNPGKNTGLELVGAKLPVQSVTWMDAVRFANLLSEKEGFGPVYTLAEDGVVMRRWRSGYRLLTDAEWEWAARAGSDMLYAGTSDPELVCQYANVADQTLLYAGWDLNTAACDDGVFGLAEVGMYRPNAWGLYDMSGNVREWVWDWFLRDRDLVGGVDPHGPEAGSLRVSRGGAWPHSPADASLALRAGGSPDHHGIYLGLRLARSH